MLSPEFYILFVDELDPSTTNYIVDLPAAGSFVTDLHFSPAPTLTHSVLSSCYTTYYSHLASASLITYYYSGIHFLSSLVLSTRWGPISLGN